MSAILRYYNSKKKKSPGIKIPFPELALPRLLSAVGYGSWDKYFHQGHRDSSRPWGLAIPTLEVLSSATTPRDPQRSLLSYKPAPRFGQPLKISFSRLICLLSVSEGSYFPSIKTQDGMPKCITDTRQPPGFLEVLLKITSSKVERNWNIYTKHTISTEFTTASWLFKSGQARTDCQTNCHL